MAELDFTRVIELSAKVGIELVFARPGSDAGLLPLNDLLGQIEEFAVEAGELPEALKAGLAAGRELVNGVFDREGVFDEAVLGALGEWAQWLQGAWAALQEGRGVAPFGRREGGSEPAAVTEGSGEIPAAGGSEDSLVLNLEQDVELLREFTSESIEHLQNIELGVLALEDRPSDAETLASIFRAFHTIKGGSGLLNLTPIFRVSHELEGLLDLARRDRIAITPGVTNVILAGGDLLRRFVEEIEGQVSGRRARGPIRITTEELLGRIRELLRMEDSGEESLIEVVTADEAASEEGVSVANDRLARGTKRAELGGRTARMIKVDTRKLDSLVDLVGEMVIAQSQVVQDPDVAGIRSERLTRNLAQLARITAELQRMSMALRMVPIRATFQKMTRLVRDVAARVGKKVELTMSGEETELDRTIVEEISDPLIHMIRNSVDHGIESPEARLAAGKPEEGRLHLQASHRGGNIVIQLVDDGAGLKTEAILKKARERGLVREGQELSEFEIHQLIFLPGFSTAEKISEISGRGVGMDVVQKNIERLRGRIDIQSRRGLGCTITIVVPLTLAIIDGLIAGVGSERYILPAFTVRGAVRPGAEALATVQSRGELLELRGKLVPLIRLGRVFGIESRAKRVDEGIVVLLESDQQVWGLLVDELLGKQELVIKSLGGGIQQSPSVAGAAILGDGRVGLILDPEALIRRDGALIERAA